MKNRPASAKDKTKLRRRRGLFARFRRDRSGATAIEFALLAVPFFALTFAIIETFLLFFASQAIETATERGARLIRTGQAQMQGLTAETFKEAICATMGGLFNCIEKLRVDVRTYEFFEAVDLGHPIDEEGNLVQNFLYEPGEGGDVIVVRAFYEWPIYTNLLGLGLANLANGAHLIGAATTFRNEPF